MLINMLMKWIIFHATLILNWISGATHQGFFPLNSHTSLLFSVLKIRVKNKTWKICCNAYIKTLKRRYLLVGGAGCWKNSHWWQMWEQPGPSSICRNTEEGVCTNKEVHQLLSVGEDFSTSYICQHIRSKDKQDNRQWAFKGMKQTKKLVFCFLLFCYV